MLWTPGRSETLLDFFSFCVICPPSDLWRAHPHRNVADVLVDSGLLLFLSSEGFSCYTDMYSVIQYV